MADANPDYDQILSTTLAKYRDSLTDNVFEATPLLDELKSKDRIRMVDGGESIVEPLIHAANDTVATYSGWDTLDITPQTGISAARFDWRQMAGSVAINGIEEAKNSGEAAFINLLEAKVMQAEMSIAAVLNAMLYSNGAGNSGKDWNGLGNLVSATGTVGGINSATAGNEFWRSVAIAVAAERTDSKWTTAYLTATNGSDKPNFAVTTQDLFQHYEEGLVPQLRFTDNKRADSRFEHLLFKGVAVHYDLDCPTGNTYFLNTKYIGLVGHTKKWMTTSKFREVPDVDGRWAQIISYGNMTIRNRKRQAVLTGQTV